MAPSEQVPPNAASARPVLGRVRAAKRAAAEAFWLPMRVGSALWLVDTGLLFQDKPTDHLAPTLFGIFAGLFATLCVSAAVGCMLALLVFVGRTPASSAPVVGRTTRVRNWLTIGHEDALRLRSGALLAAPVLLLIFALGSVSLGTRLIVGMARPNFAALALLGLHLALFALVIAAYSPIASLGSWIALWLGRIPGIGARVFGRPLHFAVWLTCFGSLAAAGFVTVYREPLSYLPLLEIGEVFCALLFALVYTLLASRLPPVAMLVPRTCALLAFLAASFAGFTLSPTQMFSRHIAEQRLLSGRVGHEALMFAFDVDHDGYLPMFGGGDCAPFDPAKNPGAIDVPGNHIDEDCDGRDLDPKAMPRLGIFNRPVPDSVPKRMPIVLITIDAFAARHMQAFGNKRAVTPNLDAFAKRSALFTSCFSQGPSTRLSFPSIFTSRWDTQIKTKLVGKHPYPIDSSELVLGEMMRSAGYDTSAVISDPYFSRSRWSGLTAGFAHVNESPFLARPTLTHNSQRVTDAALEELHREGTAPHFLWVHYFDAHPPHQQPASVPVYGKSRSDVYDAELTYTDREVGRLLTEIEALYQGNALVIVTGDHGIAFDAPRHDKFNYGYDLTTLVLHVPLIVHAPFIKPHRQDTLVSTMDIMPTLANLLRLRGPFRFEGVSLVPEILTGKSERPQVLMHQMFIEERLWKKEEPLERVSLRTPRWNLTQDRKGGFFELYEWPTDYLEKHDLAADPRYEDTLNELRQELQLFTYMTRPQNDEPPKPRVPKPPMPAKLPQPLQLLPAGAKPDVHAAVAPPPRPPATAVPPPPSAAATRGANP